MASLPGTGLEPNGAALTPGLGLARASPRANPTQAGEARVASWPRMGNWGPVPLESWLLAGGPYVGFAAAARHSRDTGRVLGFPAGTSSLSGS
jgi:hypothetical protein